MPVGNSDRGIGLWAGQVMFGLDNSNEYIEWWHDILPNTSETFEHKGKTYTASRACGEGRWMQWMTYPSFLGIGGRVEELGCMNRREHEEYMRNYRMGIDSRPVIMNNPAPITQPSNLFFST